MKTESNLVTECCSIWGSHTKLEIQVTSSVGCFHQNGMYFLFAPEASSIVLSNKTEFIFHGGYDTMNPTDVPKAFVLKTA